MAEAKGLGINHASNCRAVDGQHGCLAAFSTVGQTAEYREESDELRKVGTEPRH